MSKRRKNKFIPLVFVLIILGAAAFYIYTQIYKKVSLKDKKFTFLYIKHEDSMNDLISELSSEGIIENTQTFKWLAEEMNLDKNMHAGKYRITNGMNMRQIINLIKYNKQEKIKLTFNYQIHNLEEFVNYVDDKLEMSEDDIWNFLQDDEKLETLFKLDPDNCFALIVPGLVELSWAITPDDFFKVLKDRYTKVWTSTRISQAKKIGFSVPEVITIASIVQSESLIESEQEKIAGVYINRLRKNMPLQADPTLKFANERFDDKRVYNVDKEINSPYNTYKYKGLPPGPICLVTQQAIDATLNYNRHNYIYFCAKPSLNGYSDFSSTYLEHQRFAAAYQRAMNKMGVSR